MTPAAQLAAGYRPARGRDGCRNCRFGVVDLSAPGARLAYRCLKFPPDGRAARRKTCDKWEHWKTEGGPE